jgi:hypothetical protein
MKPQKFIELQLNKLNSFSGKKTNYKSLKLEIHRLIFNHKFRKYTANSNLLNKVEKAIEINIEKNEPIKIVFPHGAYKLWRLKEAPEVDWAELFSTMYYTRWLKPICEIYKPGVWFDYFVDDLIIPKIDNLDIKDVNDYLNSYHEILDFLKKYQPNNFKMTITRVGDLFDSPKDFEESVQKNMEILGKNPKEITKERLTMIKLNRKTKKDDYENPKWIEENALTHDAYLMSKRETNYHFQESKIIAFSNKLPSGTVVAVGTTKSTIAKFWTRVGALKKKQNSYQEYVLSPKQIKNTKFQIEELISPD